MATKKKRKRRSANGWRGGIRRRVDGDWDVRLKWTDHEGKHHDSIRIARAATEGDALNWRAAKLRELSAPAGEKLTFSEALELALAPPPAGIDAKFATREAYRIQGKAIARVFGERRLSSIEPVEIQRYLHATPQGDATVAQRRAAFSRVYDHVRRIGMYSGANPVEETRARTTPKAPEQRLAEWENPDQRAYLGDEVQRFLDALPAELRVLQAIQLFLGCRFGEASALEWRDVDLDTGTVTIGRNQHRGHKGVPKSGKPRVSALGPHALAMLREHKALMESLKWPGWDRIVFPRPVNGADRHYDYWSYTTVRKAILKAQRAIGTSVVARTHAMRHTHITIAEVQRALDVDAAVGGDSALHRQMTGHATEKQREAYVDHRALPANRLAAKIEGAIVNAHTKPEK